MPRHSQARVDPSDSGVSPSNLETNPSEPGSSRMLPRVSDTATEERRHWPALDGVRAVSVLAIITFHADYPSFIKGGFTAVDVFFTLSGFLITWLLVSEVDALGDISFGKFYARRALRLFPALAVVLVAVVLLVIADGGLAPYRHATLFGIPAVLLYVSNWVIAFGKNPAIGGAPILGLLSITWTLAIEEQYYLLWPMTLRKLLKRTSRQRIAGYLIVTAVAEQVARIGIGFSHNMAWDLWADKATVTHTDGLLLGTALALLWTCRKDSKWWPAIQKRIGLIGIAGAVAMALLIVVPGASNIYTNSVWEILMVYATLAVMTSLIALPASVLSHVFALRPLVWIGQRSYGIYLWHLTIIALMYTFALPQKHLHFTRFALEVVGSLVIAGISYRFIEQPFLRRKARFTRVKPEVTSAT
jgi:peptidoglycan/LPS O-acetylase OafA/YrhL